MSLADEIRLLRDRALADLRGVHDYYADTKIAWDIVHEYIADGKTLAVKNVVTGTVTRETDLAGKAQSYMTQHLRATFQQFISIFEDFLFGFLRLWLREHPQSLSAKKVDFGAILKAADKDAITLHVIDKQLNETRYERPAAWFAYLESLVNLSCPTADEIGRIAEAKASRDFLEHNAGVANKVYESKAGALARYKDGQGIDIPEPYHPQTWELICKVVTDLSNAGIAKA